MSPKVSSSDSLENYPELKLALSQSQRQIQSVDGSFSGSQPGQYQFGLAASGRLTIGDLSIRTVAYGNGQNAVATTQPKAALGKDELGYSKLTFSRPGISEWYINEAKGLHHWFQVDKKVGQGNLWVKLASSGSKGVQTGPQRIEFATNQGSVSYAGLKVWDATGKKLPATMQLRGAEIVIGVEDAEAKYPVTIDPLWNNEAILSENPPGTDHRFGNSVSVSDNTAVVGTPGANSRSGKAYVFSRSGSTWTEQAILSASDESDFARFGESVSVSGDNIVVGARFADHASDNGGETTYIYNAGKAYVFSRSGNTWTEQAILSSPNPTEEGNFGTSVSVSGNTVIVGEPYASLEGTFTGVAHIFSLVGDTWLREAYMYSGQFGLPTRFGWSVCVNGDTAIIGEPNAEASGITGAGRAAVWSRSGGVWTQQAILTASDPQQAGFGNSVSLSGDTALIGAPYANPNDLFFAGQAYIVTRSGATWTEQAILSASDKSASAQFGESVSLSGNTAIVGARYADPGGVPNAGQAYIFTRSSSAWTEVNTLYGYQTAFSNFGASVSVSGDTAFVGEPFTDVDDTSDAGTAHVFRFDPSIRASVEFGSSGVTGGKSVTGTVTLSSAPTASTVVSLSSNNVALTVPASVTVAAGSTTATFTASSSVVTSDTRVTVAASGTGLTTGTRQLTVRTPRVSSVRFSAGNITFGETVLGTVSLQSVAPAGGVLVTLFNSDPSSLDCPDSVTVPAGQSKATFVVTGKSVAAETYVGVVATPSFNEKSDIITVNPPAVHITELYASDFILGTITFGTVRLSSPAPAGGYVVTLASLTTGLSVPATATVPEGETFANFEVNSTRALQNRTIRATFQGSTKTDLVSVTYNAITTVTASASTIAVGQDSMVTVTLNAPIPLDGRLVVDVTSQKAGVLSIPSTRLTAISGGSSSVTFPVTGLKAGVTNLYVKILNHGVKSVKITVTNP
jgi:hypothetical protein